MSNFNRYRSPSLPELAEATCALLEIVWDDDYESFGLVNPEEDPELFMIVSKLDAVVRADKLPVISGCQIAALREEGWRDVESEEATEACASLQTADGYPSKALELLEDAWMVIEAGNGQ